MAKVETTTEKTNILEYPVPKSTKEYLAVMTDVIPELFNIFQERSIELKKKIMNYVVENTMERNHISNAIRILDSINKELNQATQSYEEFKNTPNICETFSTFDKMISYSKCHYTITQKYSMLKEYEKELRFIN